MLSPFLMSRPGLRTTQQRGQSRQKLGVRIALRRHGLSDLLHRRPQKPGTERRRLFFRHTRGQRQNGEETVRQFLPLGDPVAPHFLPELNQKFASRVVFAEKVPPDVQARIRVKVEGLDVQFLHFGEAAAAHRVRKRLCMLSGGSVSSRDGSRGAFQVLPISGGGVLEQFRYHIQGGSQVQHHIPLFGAVRKPNPALCLCSSGSSIISMASSRCMGGITKRSSKVQSEVNRYIASASSLEHSASRNMRSATAIGTSPTVTARRNQRTAFCLRSAYRTTPSWPAPNMLAKNFMGTRASSMSWNKSSLMFFTVPSSRLDITGAMGGKENHISSVRHPNWGGGAS